MPLVKIPIKGQDAPFVRINPAHVALLYPGVEDPDVTRIQMTDWSADAKAGRPRSYLVEAPVSRLVKALGPFVKVTLRDVLRGGVGHTCYLREGNVGSMESLKDHYRVYLVDGAVLAVVDIGTLETSVSLQAEII